MFELIDEHGGIHQQYLISFSLDILKNNFEVVPQAANAAQARTVDIDDSADFFALGVVDGV
jgi:hypothetical protein